MNSKSFFIGNHRKILAVVTVVLMIASIKGGENVLFNLI